MSREFYLGILLFVGLQRLFELFYSRRNEKNLLQKGAIEYGSEHFIWMKILHFSWIVSLILMACFLPFNPFFSPWPWAFFLLFLLGQTVRILAIVTLKDRWSVIVLMLPGNPPVARGIYKIVRHPNYLGVVIEILFLPLIGGFIFHALLFSVLNLWLLKIRLAVEEKALSDMAQYGAK